MKRLGMNEYGSAAVATRSITGGEIREGELGLPFS